MLLVSHNRLVSLPEEISQLSDLIELDASCNQLSHLPVQLGDLQHLEVLNLRKNFLVELPRGALLLFCRAYWLISLFSSWKTKQS